MNKSDLISIIVPVYNVKDYLPRCLDTIIQQTYPNLEIILIDDGSIDSCGNICDEFASKDQRIIVIHQNNIGRGPARNTGLALVHGQYVMFVDGDDYLRLDAIEKMHEALQLHSNWDMSMSSYKATDSLCEDISACNTMVSNWQEIHQPTLVEEFFNGPRSFFSLWGKLYKQQIIKDIWFKDYERCQDVDFVLRVILKIKIAAWTDEKLYYYVQRGGSAIHQPDAMLTEARCRTQIYFDNLRTLPDSLQCYEHYFLKFLFSYMVRTIGLNGNNKKNDQFCKYEKQIRNRYWSNSHFSFIEKVAMTMNVRFPQFIRKVKRITGGRLSWHLLKKF